MAPKAKASAPAHLVITGKLKGPPKISQDGSAVVVKKTLDDGATVQETFPKRRVCGKQKQLRQLIPAEDVIRTIEEASAAVADSLRAEGDRKVDAISSYASKQIDKERARARFQAGKVVAQKKATKAKSKFIKDIHDAVARRTQRPVNPQSFADAIAASRNTDAARPRATELRRKNPPSNTAIGL
jgi:hypothetical protein